MIALSNPGPVYNAPAPSQQSSIPTTSSSSSSTLYRVPGSSSISVPTAPTTHTYQSQSLQSSAAVSSASSMTGGHGLNTFVPVNPSTISSSSMADVDFRRISGAQEDLRMTHTTSAAPSLAAIASAPVDTKSSGSSRPSMHQSHDMFELEDNIAELSLGQGHNVDPDRYNAQMVSVYVDDIMQHLRNTEVKRQPSASYMSRQTDINAKMREILIDWLVEVHLKFKLRQETLFLTVNIIDRFLERRAVSRSKLQLVGCTAMLIASKYEEIYAPEVQDFVYVSDKAYTREQILAMESIILNALEFNLTVPYAMRFAERYVKFASDSEQFKEMVNFLIELTLQDYRFLRYVPSTVASSAISLALHLSGNASWSAALEREAHYSEADIRPCVMDLWNLAAKDNPKYRAVRKKYSSSRFHGVAKIVIEPPAQE